MAYVKAADVNFGDEATSSRIQRMIDNQEDHETRISGLEIPQSAMAVVATSESKSAAGGFGDMTTPGPSVTLTVPASGKVLICLKSGMRASATATGNAYAQAEMTGANTGSLAYTRIGGIYLSASIMTEYAAAVLVDGLNPGSTTFKMVYSAATNAGQFFNRQITVETRN